MSKTSLSYVTGSEALTSALRAIPADIRTEILARGTKEAIQPIKIAAKRYAKRSEATGALRESITDKVKSYPENAKAVGLVGPDRQYYARGKRVSAFGALLSGKARRRPANYAHLVENGHVAVAPRKGTSRRKGSATVAGWVPARPFIRPAVLTTSAEQSAAFTRGLEKGLAASIKKHGGNA